MKTKLFDFILMGLTDWGDPAGTLCALSADIPGLCAGELRDDTDHLPGSPASHTYILFSQSPVISRLLLLKCHHS
jgi:hypothetical protein